MLAGAAVVACSEEPGGPGLGPSIGGQDLADVPDLGSGEDLGRADAAVERVFNCGLPAPEVGTWTSSTDPLSGVLVSVLEGLSGIESGPCLDSQAHVSLRLEESEEDVFGTSLQVSLAVCNACEASVQMPHLARLDDVYEVLDVAGTPEFPGAATRVFRVYGISVTASSAGQTAISECGQTVVPPDLARLDTPVVELRPGETTVFVAREQRFGDEALFAQRAGPDFPSSDRHQISMPETAQLGVAGPCLECDGHEWNALWERCSSLGYYTTAPMSDDKEIGFWVLQGDPPLARLFAQEPR